MTLAAQLAFSLYFLLIAAISYAALTRTRSPNDYIIGSRSLSAPVAALSAGASDMSGWLLLGLPGAVFLSGLAESWIVVGLVIGAWVNWRVVAGRLRQFSEALDDAVTLPQFFARRVGGDAAFLRIVSTLLVIAFFTIYTAAGFVAGAKLFASTLGLEYVVALALGVGIIMIYTAIGGFLAVTWTDFLQALLMLAALVVVPILTLMALPDEPSSARPGTESMSVLGVVSLLAWGLGYFGQPHILARFMAIDDVASVPRARRIAMSWMVVASIGALSVGVLGARYFAAGGLADAETVFIALAQTVLNPWAAGIVVAAVLAAVMSTVDSQLLVASTALIEDVLRPRIPDMSPRAVLWASRATVIVIALAAGAAALDPDSQVLGLVAYAWAGLGASFGPAVLFCLFSRRTTALGLVAGMLTGAAVTVVWHNLSGGLFDLYELLPAFAAAALAIHLGNRLSKFLRKSVDRSERDAEIAASLFATLR
ncbi:MAG: sodium/proline symporter PutP [Gammaproteobacteria bacterium]|nr:sodium/proline symporter PutP [Gammaproteobacteria bacterium]